MNHLFVTDTTDVDTKNFRSGFTPVCRSDLVDFIPFLRHEFSLLFGAGLQPHRVLGHAAVSVLADVSPTRGDETDSTASLLLP
jgi:hypothetical protein